jgi:U3 small nucleolar ribonucleoprotein component
MKRATAATIEARDVWNAIRSMRSSVEPQVVYNPAQNERKGGCYSFLQAVSMLQDTADAA